MSTKIYDAYKLTGKYDIVSLNTALSDLRQQVTHHCENLIANIVVRQFLSMYYMNLLHGTNIPTDTDTVTTTVLEKIAQQDMKSAWAYLYCKITAEIADLSNTTTRPFGYNFYNNLLLFPLKDKILAMYFGNTDIRRFIENHEMFEDYHYQNQMTFQIKNGTNENQIGMTLSDQITFRQITDGRYSCLIQKISCRFLIQIVSKQSCFQQMKT